MNKVILLGMVFNDTDAPDFGGIRQSESAKVFMYEMTSDEWYEVVENE